jgi:DNA polymerase-3 subunit alpha
LYLQGNVYGEVPSKLLNVGEKQAADALLWWKEQFQEDLYIEIMRHQQEDENRINPVLIQFSKKYDVKLVATNSVFYLKQEEANAHDILLCVKDGEKQATPIGRGRGYRYGLPNQEYYFKTPAQMQELFADVPQALESIPEILDKITAFDLAREVLLPKFDIPDAFQSTEDDADGGKRGENAYLRHITYEGAKARYGSLNDELTERIDFELSVIEKYRISRLFFNCTRFYCCCKRNGCVSGSRTWICSGLCGGILFKDNQYRSYCVRLAF